MEAPLTEDWIAPLRQQLQKNLKDLATTLADQEKWLDQHEESLEEAAHEEAVRQLEKLETVMECLEEALEALD